MQLLTNESIHSEGIGISSKSIQYFEMDCEDASSIRENTTISENNLENDKNNGESNGENDSNVASKGLESSDSLAEKDSQIAENSNDDHNGDLNNITDAKKPEIKKEEECPTDNGDKEAKSEMESDESELNKLFTELQKSMSSSDCNRLSKESDSRPESDSPLENIDKIMDEPMPNVYSNGKDDHSTTEELNSAKSLDSPSKNSNENKITVKTESFESNDSDKSIENASEKSETTLVNTSDVLEKDKIVESRELEKNTTNSDKEPNENIVIKAEKQDDEISKENESNVVDAKLSSYVVIKTEKQDENVSTNTNIVNDEQIVLPKTEKQDEVDVPTKILDNADNVNNVKVEDDVKIKDERIDVDAQKVEDAKLAETANAIANETNTKETVEGRGVNEIIELDKDNDCMMVENGDSKSNDDKKPDKSADIIDLSDDEKEAEPPKSANKIPNSEPMEVDTATTNAVPESDSNLSNGANEKRQTTDNNDSAILKQYLETKPAETEPDLFPLDSMLQYRATFDRMSREDLEGFCLVKIAEAIAKHGELEEAQARLKSQAKNLEVLKKTLTVTTKQSKDLELVMKNLVNEHKKRRNEIIEPVKIARSVGFQVGASGRFNKAAAASFHPQAAPPPQPIKSSAQPATAPPSKMSTPTSSFVLATNNRVIPITLNKKNLKVVPQAALAAAAHRIPIEPLKAPVNANQSADWSNVKIAPPTTQSQTNKAVVRAKRPADSMSIDLTSDDPPPFKQMHLANAAFRNPGSQLTTRMVPVQNFANSSQAPPRLQVRSPNSLAQLRVVPRSHLGGNGVGEGVRSPNMRIGIPIRQNAHVEQQHPPPLPNVPTGGARYMMPQPTLKITRVPHGIVVSWDVDGAAQATVARQLADVASYQIYAYQETAQSPHADLWKKIGDVRALPLPMACTLTQFMGGYRYHFAVRGVNGARLGPFSRPASILLGPAAQDDN